MTSCRSGFLLAGCLVWLALAARGEGVLAFWDFARGTQGWTTNAGVTHDHITREGWTMTVTASDPNLTGPPVDFPPDQWVTVTDGQGTAEIGPFATLPRIALDPDGRILARARRVHAVEP